jgi:hypothetical protein
MEDFCVIQKQKGISMEIITNKVDSNVSFINGNTMYRRR